MRTIRNRVTSGEVMPSKHLAINHWCETGELGLPNLKKSESWETKDWFISRHRIGECRDRNGDVNFVTNGQMSIKLVIKRLEGVFRYVGERKEGLSNYLLNETNPGTTTRISKDMPFPMLQSENGFLSEMVKYRDEGFPIEKYLDNEERLMECRVEEDVGKNFIYRSLINNCRELESRHHEFDKRLFGFNGESRTEPTPTGLAYIAEEILLRKEE